MTVRFQLPDEKSSDDLRQDDEPSLISIGIFGASEQDKTNFIKIVTEHEIIATCEIDLIRTYDFSVKDVDFSLVEFPSFGNSHETDDETVFLRITDWLEKSYLQGQRLYGLIYLHRAIDNREHGLDLRNFRIFRALSGVDQAVWGGDNPRRATIGITSWDQDDDDKVKAREKALKETPEFWGDMDKEYLRIERITPDREKSIDLLLHYASTGPMTLRVQDEIIDEKISAKDTSAFRELKHYQRRHAIREAEELERATQLNFHREQLKKCRQLALVRSAHQETKFEEIIGSKNAKLNKLESLDEKGTVDSSCRMSLQTERMEAFQQLRLDRAQQEHNLTSELLKLEEENSRRLQGLENAKLRRRFLAHKESLVQQQRLLEHCDSSWSRQAFMYIHQLNSGRGGNDYQQKFCYHCLDQLSLFDEHFRKSLNPSTNTTMRRSVV
ncbi:hypothetical protein ACLMJK_003287 [Lecanora helva]